MCFRPGNLSSIFWLDSSISLTSSPLFWAVGWEILYQNMNINIGEWGTFPLRLGNATSTVDSVSQEPYKALKGLLGPQGRHKALKGLMKP